MNNTEKPITATATDRERMDAIIQFEVEQLFAELYPKADDQDVPF